MKPLSRVLPLAALFCLLAGSYAFSDTSSTNYTLVEYRFTGGGGNASSTNYQVADSSFGNFSQSAMTSTNYALEAGAGISSGAGIGSINSVSPGDHSKFYSDGNASYTVSAVSQDGDTLQYSAKQDATTKVSAQASSTVSWALSTSDQGRHTMGLSVIDPQGTALKKQEAYVVRRPTK